MKVQLLNKSLVLLEVAVVALAACTCALLLVVQLFNTVEELQNQKCCKVP